MKILRRLLDHCRTVAQDRRVWTKVQDDNLRLRGDLKEYGRIIGELTRTEVFLRQKVHQLEGTSYKTLAKFWLQLYDQSCQSRRKLFRVYEANRAKYQSAQRELQIAKALLKKHDLLDRFQKKVDRDRSKDTVSPGDILCTTKTDRHPNHYPDVQDIYF